MLYKLQLKNADQHIIVDEETYTLLKEIPFLREWDAIHNFRLHQNGFPVFQKKLGKKYTNIFLNRFVAEKILGEELSRSTYVMPKNHNKLDCRAKNLQILPASYLRAKESVKRSKGYHKEKDKYRVRFYYEGRSVNVGSFATEEEAKLAYEAAKRELMQDNV